MSAFSLEPRIPVSKSRLFDRAAIRLMLIAGLVPNGIFLVAMPFFIAQRLIAPLLYLLATAAALFLPPFCAYLLFLLVAAIDLGLIISIAFHLPLHTALDSVRFLSTIDVTASTFYVTTVTLTFTMPLLAALLLNRHREEIRFASPIPVALLAFALVGAELHFNLPYAAKAEPEFDSAMTQNGLAADAIAARGNNLLVVLVEGLGAIANANEKALLSAELERAAASGNYTLTHGTTRYSGSTTAAESRELCGRWGDHLDYIHENGPFDCLPRQLAEHGYATTAYHGYTSAMFARNIWYPKIGFEDLHFADELARDVPMLVPNRCGSVFEGLCDTEVAHAVRARLLAADKRPKLVYWLTLNSHVPFVAKPDGQLRCGTEEAAIANRTTCELTELWGDVFKSVASIATDPELPPTDILVVGDHHTPLWERDAKKRFILGSVDWYFLRSSGRLHEQQLAKRWRDIPLRTGETSNNGIARPTTTISTNFLQISAKWD